MRVSRFFVERACRHSDRQDKQARKHDEQRHARAQQGVVDGAPKVEVGIQPGLRRNVEGVGAMGADNHEDGQQADNVGLNDAGGKVFVFHE